MKREEMRQRLLIIRDQVIALEQMLSEAVSYEACPKCGAVGDAIEAIPAMGHATRKRCRDCGAMFEEIEEPAEQ